MQFLSLVHHLLGYPGFILSFLFGTVEGDVALISRESRQLSSDLWTSLLTLLNLALNVQALLAPGHVTAAPT